MLQLVPLIMKFKIKLWPLIVLYIFLVLILSSSELVGDEGRYLMFANNLLHGYYSPHADVNLWNGPGYPLVLFLIILFKLPLVTAKLMNSLFLFLAITYFYYTLSSYISNRPAEYISYVLGVVPPFWRHVHHILTESLALFLVCGMLFHLSRYFNAKKKSSLQLILASIFMGYLAITKIFYGYVIMAGVVLYAILYLCKKTNYLKQTLLFYVLAFLFCVPYLLYTYTITAKPFYWGNSGGLSLYWMSTPYENELGDWYRISNWYGSEDARKYPQLYENHRQFFSDIEHLPSIEKDDALKRKAIENIIQYPFKYIRNWIANVGRLLFHYPYSYISANMKLLHFAYMIPNMFIVVLAVLCIYPSYKKRKNIPYEIYCILLFGLISFFGSSLVSAYSRQFQPLVPVFSLWICFVLFRIIKIEAR